MLYSSTYIVGFEIVSEFSYHSENLIKCYIITKGQITAQQSYIYSIIYQCSHYAQIITIIITYL